MIVGEKARIWNWQSVREKIEVSIIKPKGVIDKLDKIILILVHMIKNYKD